MGGGLSQTFKFYFRMLVGSEFVGAVIGRQGQTIHGITTQTRAR
jgi:predicted RNA-binding protein YlqC (UPF0109 family)